MFWQKYKTIASRSSRFCSPSNVQTRDIVNRFGEKIRDCFPFLCQSFSGADRIPLISHDPLLSGDLPHWISWAFGARQILPCLLIRSLRDLDFSYQTNLIMKRRIIHLILSLSCMLLSAESLLAQKRQEDTESHGRLKLMINASLVSFGYYGWAVPTMLKVDNHKAGIGLYMLTSAGGFVLPFMLTQNMDVTAGQANLYGYGASRGIYHGMAFAELMRSDHESFDVIDRHLAMGMLFSVGEGLAGYQMAKFSNWEEGSSATIGTFGDAGMIALPLALLIANPETEKYKALLASSLMGGAGGLFLGSKMIATQSYSYGDANVLRISGLMGAVIPLAIMEVMESDNSRVQAMMALLGGASGLAIGHYATRNVDFSSGQGGIFFLGVLAGTAFGAGMGYLLSGEGEDNWKAPLIGSVIGGMSGYGFMHHVLSRKAPKAKYVGLSMQVQLAPEGMIGLMGKENAMRKAGFVGVAGGTSPLVRASIRF